jgi:hypothetical protein
MRDNNDDGQLFVTDSHNRAVRTVDIKSGAISTFIKCDIFDSITHQTQDETGNLNVISAGQAVYCITYREKTI